MRLFLAGLGIGSAIGMLIAPRRGAELREHLLDTARERFDGVRERVEDAGERMEPVLKDVHDSLDPMVKQGREKLERAAGKISELKEKSGNGNLLTILNEWPHERLIEIEGIGPVLATRIIQNRPYESEQDLLEAKALPPSAIESLRKAA
ncbi:MAG TPA: YtxH domain-containing protein [Terriglobales bacterium]|nr:YtxH domain-containing protein [Terriglobales bacterium]